MTKEINSSDPAVRWAHDIGRQLIKEVRFTVTSECGIMIEDIFRQCEKCHDLKNICWMLGDSFTCINCLFAQPDPEHSFTVNSVYRPPDHSPLVYPPPDYYSSSYHPFYFVFPRLPVINPFPALITYVPQRKDGKDKKNGKKETSSIK